MCGAILAQESQVSRAHPRYLENSQLFSNTYIKEGRGRIQTRLMGERGLSKLLGLSTLPKTLGSSDSFSKKANPPERGDSHFPERGRHRTRSRQRDRGRRRRRSDRENNTPRSETNRSRRTDEGQRKVSEDDSWEKIPGSEFQLGATSGVIAAGAWGARLEIAGMIEAGCSKGQLLRMIRSGEERLVPLRLEVPKGGVCPSERGHFREGSYSPGSLTGRKRSRTRSAAGPPFEHPRDDVAEEEVKQLLEDEGDNIDDVIAEQKLILSTLARGEDDPPWRSSQTLSKESLYSSGGKVSGGLRMEAPPVTFAKKASPPPNLSKVVRQSTPSLPPPTREEVDEQLPTFSRKAKPPPPGTLPEPTKMGLPPVARGGKGGNTKNDTLEARELEDLKKFASESVEIFESMEVLGIQMDLARYVRVNKGIDKDKFLLHTAPSRASTGLRYVRVMKGLMAWVEGFDPIPAEEQPSPLECLRLVEYTELLLQKRVGFNTPQALLFAIDFFSKAFGFNPTGADWNRAKRLAMRYKKSKPGLSNRAPLFGKETLKALEDIVLNDLFESTPRIAAGKLRLCCQASIRYDDLLHTPLSSLEWVRRKGGTTVVAVRAKSTQGKNKARPWIASLMGTCQENDKWLCTLLEMVVDIHGSTWKVDDHFGKDVSRDHEGFTRKPRKPPRIENDVAVVKKALKMYEKDGGSPGITDREIDLLRWHGGKAITLTSLMQHLELDPKMIRLAGDWAAKEDTMPDTYLREAQLLVLRGKESCLSYLRSGGDFCSLVSGGLVGSGPPTGDGENKTGSESHGDPDVATIDAPAPSADEVRLRTSARLAGARAEYQGFPGKALCSAFWDCGFDSSGSPLVEVAEAETRCPDVPAEEIQKLLEPNNPSDDVYVLYSFDGAAKVVKTEPTEDGGEAASGVIDLKVKGPEPMDAVMEDDDDDQEGRTLRFAMVAKPTPSSKLHLPTTGSDGSQSTLAIPTPKCGAKGDYSFVMASEAIDPATDLCIRCFGHKSEKSCGKLCSVKTKVGDDVYRCARRCSTDCTESGVHLCHVHGF